MSLHEQLYRWTADQGLDEARARRLWALSGLDQAPADVMARLRLGAAGLAAGLLGLGVMMWVAANWGELPRGARFGLLQGLLATTLLGAWTRPAWRGAAGLLSLLSLGGLLALFGQTYPTGADTWQLFALWAALALPLCWGARSELIWTPWVLVVVTGISLWAHAHAGFQWAVSSGALAVHACSFLALALLCVGMALKPPTPGVQPWAWRLAVLLGVVALSATAVGGLLFVEHVLPQFPLGLLVLAGGLAAAWRWREVYALSALALALDTLLLAGLGRLMLKGQQGDPIGAMLLLGLVAAGLLTASVQLILRRVRTQGGTAEVAP
ncbi:DUF2157 domain-containing protein [Roseateles sp. DB2]|uniref:DUF2157 domain-containing protein n=1 Tax=Roseateles sp. DB2 TaxID=3453717 RepID=UPI003EF0811A